MILNTELKCVICQIQNVKTKEKRQKKKENKIKLRQKRRGAYKKLENK
jgi:hypothetical protein